MKFSRIILSTDVREIITFVRRTGITVNLTKNPPGKESEKCEIKPDTLYVFAYKNPTAEQLPLLAANAGRHENFLAICARPGSSITADQLGETLLVSKDSLEQRVQQEFNKLIGAVSN